MSGSGISWAICKSASRSRQITTPAPYHSVFYRPGALPAAQPTASKRWRHQPVFENTYFTFFSDFEKRDFLRFLRCRQKVLKSLQQKFSHQSVEVQILRSVITVIHFSYLFVSLVYLRTYRRLSHTVISFTVYCKCEHYVRISEQRC